MLKLCSVIVGLVLLAVPASAASSCNDFFGCLFAKHDRYTAPQAAVPYAGYNGAPIMLSGQSRRALVPWVETRYPVGSIIVNTPERALYLVLGNGQAEKYAVGVGRDGFQWSGVSYIERKAEWPGWTPPDVMIAREAANGHFIPAHMDGGPANPLGARALYLAGLDFRIHGTNNEGSIGGAVSSGCIRMMNADVIDLYNRVKIGAKVWVYQ